MQSCAVLRSSCLLVLGMVLGLTSLARAQDEAPLLPSPRDPSAPEAETVPLESEPAEEGAAEEEAFETAEERRVPIVPVPPRPSPADEGLGVSGEPPLEEGEPIDEGFELPPIPDEPPTFRLRAGAGVSLPTGGPTEAAARFSQDFEVQMRELAPFYFGLGGAEVVNSAFVLGQLGVNVGLAAWIAEDPLYRVQGAIHFHIGAVFGGGYLDVDLGGEIDLRMLVADDIIELHARGGFFTFGGVSSINISGGIGVAF